MGEKKHERYIAALEIGSSKIRGAVGIVDNSGVVDVIAVEEEKLIDKVRYGCIQNMDVSNTIYTVLQRLESYPQIAPRRITGVYVSLGGRSLISKHVNVSLTLPNETEITRPIINELYQQAAASVGPERDVVDVVPMRFTVDNKTQNNPIGSYGQQVGGMMTVLSCAPQMKRMMRRVIAERLELNINGYICRPLAEASLVLTDDEQRLGCMFVDFGAETTTVAIFRNGAPVYVAALPIGSRNITLDLIALKYIEKRAEEIKKSKGNAFPQEAMHRKGQTDDIDYTEINNYIHARADEIVANILAQMKYAEVSDTDLPGGIIIVGGGARLHGFNELLSQQSKMKVRQGAPNTSVRISDGSVERSDMVDVISILVAAAKSDSEACLSEAPEPEEEPAADDHSYEGEYSGEKETGEHMRSRIGHYDDTEVEDEWQKKEPRKHNGREKEGGLGSLFAGLKKRIEDMMNDNSDFQ